MTCAVCGKALTFNELGLNAKFNANAGRLCLDCLARKCGVPRERLLEKIEEFRRAGCVMFTDPGLERRGT